MSIPGLDLEKNQKQDLQSPSPTKKLGFKLEKIKESKDNFKEE